MRLFRNSAAKGAVWAAVVATALFVGSGRSDATTVPFSAGPGSGDNSLNTVINLPGDPAGGTLTFTLTIGADFSNGDPDPGATGSFNMTVAVPSDAAWSLTSLSTLTRSTTGTTNLGDGTGPAGLVFNASELTDVSTWTVGVPAGALSLTIDSTFSGFCGGDFCFPPRSTLSYDFVANPPSFPLPPALPLFAGGLGTLGVLGWRRKRKE